MAARVDVRGSGASKKKLVAPATFTANTRYAVAIAQFIVNLMNDRGHPPPRVASGDTERGVFVRVSPRGVAQVVSEKGSIVFTLFGRGPGKFPPPDKVKKWIEDKPITPKPGPDGKTPSINSLAFLIGRKIATEGIKPITTTGEIENALETLGRPFLQDMGDAQARQTAEITINNFVKRNKELGLKTTVSK